MYPKSTGAGNQESNKWNESGRSQLVRDISASIFNHKRPASGKSTRHQPEFATAFSLRLARRRDIPRGTHLEFFPRKSRGGLKMFHVEHFCANKGRVRS